MGAKVFLKVNRKYIIGTYYLYIFLPLKSKLLLKGILQNRASVLNYSRLDYFINMPSSLKEQTKRRTNPLHKVQLPYKIAKINFIITIVIDT